MLLLLMDALPLVARLVVREVFGIQSRPVMQCSEGVLIAAGVTEA